MAVQLRRFLRRPDLPGPSLLNLWIGLAGGALVLIVVLALIGIPSSASGATSTSTLTVVEDTFIKNTSPYKNYAGYSTVEADTYPNVKRILLRFHVENLPDDAVVSSARLRMFVVDASTYPGTVNTVGGPWSETTVTWSNAPAVGGVISNFSIPAILGTWREADVTPVVTGNGYVDFYVVTQSDNGVDYSSREAGSNPPTLVLQWSESHSSPTPTPAETSASPSPTPTKTLAPATPTTAPTPIPTPTPVPSSAGNPPSAPRGSAPVFAYYYLWWGDNHWQSKLGPNYPFGSPPPNPLPATLEAGGCNAVNLYEGNQLTDVPVDNFWSLDDPGRILEDVRTAAGAGLRGFIVNWNGTGDPNQTVTSTSNGNNRRLDALVQAVNQVNAEGTNFKLWVSYKASSKVLSLSHIQGDLTYFTNKYGSSPAFDRRSNKPVFIWTGSRKYTLATVQAVSTQFRPLLYLMGDENWNTWGDGRAAYLDGDAYYWSSQNPYTNPSSFSQLQNLAATVRSTLNPDGSVKQFFAPLTPGYNSEILRGGSCVPRNNGDTMRRLFEGNTNSTPDGWAFISWNEIAENTHLVPLERWGRFYLDYLKALVNSPR
jgi:hypothetical protein